MGEKKLIDEFIECVPLYTNWKKVLIIYIYHILIFIAIMISLYKITSYNWLLSIPEAFLLTVISNGPFIYMLIKNNKIRQKYLKKYKKHPWHQFYLRYSYTSPFGAAALYFPLTVKTDYFLPEIIQLPSNTITQTLFPIYLALPFAITLLIIGIIIINNSQDFDTDIGNYLHIMNPDKKRVLRKGIFEYIRHPRLLSRLILSISLAVFANNILAILIAIFHFIPYYIFMIILDKQLERIYGEEIKKYHEKTPYLIPKIKDWRKIVHNVLKK
jgi:protein-S-isoprenylcysteine O-methyltransferase Ste14